MAHVEKWLDKCPTFPPKLLVEPATGRVSRSVIMTGRGNYDERDETSINLSYVWGNAIHKFLPPFPTHRDADQISLNTEIDDDQGIPSLIDMTLEEVRAEDQTTGKLGERMDAMHEAAAEAYVQMYRGEAGNPPGAWARAVATLMAEAQYRETEKTLPPGAVPKIARIARNDNRHGNRGAPLGEEWERTI